MKHLLFVTLLALMAAVVPASADSIVFSGELSDHEAGIGVFSATVGFTFDAGTQVLTLQIFNGTDWPTDYTLAEVFINVSDDVTGMSIIDDGGYDASLAVNARADGFGIFDYQIDLASNNDGLDSQDSASLTFQVAGLDLSVDDFFCHFATGAGIDKGDATAAIKFTQGPNDDSVYAIPLQQTPVPEPATVVLLLLGVGGFAARRKLS